VRSLARLETHELAWYALVPYIVYTLFRSGRVVVPLLAILPLVQLRRRWLDPPLVGINTCFAGHFALDGILLSEWGYLDPRHTLVLVALLVPFAAMFAARLQVLMFAARRGRAWIIAVCVALLPLLAYALRPMNAEAAESERTAEWLRQYDPEVRGKLLTGGSSEKRIAFYAEMRWNYWLQDPGEYAVIRGEFLAQRPDYLALETGGGFERSGHARLIERLRADLEIGPRMRPILERDAFNGGRLHVFEFNWPAR
jgi:hypothetical protein